MTWTTREDCRLCGHAGLETVLELAPTPPANEFVRANDPPQDLIPLYLARCLDCGHVQLPVVVDPERLFGNYVYVSGTSPSFVQHFKDYAANEALAARLRHGDLVVEIGSNDGTLLSAFKSLGQRVIGVDPARDIAARATAAGLETWPEFFDRTVAHRLRWEHGEASMVVANNVFAHADDLKTIALGVRDLLSPGGVFVFEVQYLVDLVEKNLFDMVYHEHLSYHSLGPLIRFFSLLGMSMFDAQRVDTHGGSIRCRVAPVVGVKPTDRLRTLLDHEVNALAMAHDPWGKMRRRIDEAGAKLRTFLDEQHRTGKRVIGYGAPAKLTTLCHQFGITKRDIHYIVDDSPWKQDLYAPGTRIPVTGNRLGSNYTDPSDNPDAVVIFAWNFAESIAKKLRAQEYTGRIVAPLPEFKEMA